MKRVIALPALTALLALSQVGCVADTSAMGDPTLEEMIESLEERVPGRDRASVRVCEAMLDPGNRLESLSDVLAFATEGLKELEGSDDPRGMKTALQEALIGLGDAAIEGNPGDYENAVMYFATVCTDIVSGEYGK